MKVTVIIIGLLGVLTSVGLGGKWLYDYHQNKGTLEKLDKVAAEWGGNVGAPQRAHLMRVVNTGYALVILGVLALIDLFFITKMPLATAAGLLLAGIVPGVMYPTAFIGTFFLILAGILAIFVKKKAPAPG